MAGNEPFKIFAASLLGGASHPRHVLCQTALVEQGLAEPSRSSPKQATDGLRCPSRGEQLKLNE